MMQERWVKSEDGTRLWLGSTRVDGDVAAEVLLTHGLGEHASRYEHVAARFAQAGLRLHAYDLRGHGRSEGRRGDAPSYDCFLRDLDRVRAAVERPDAPLFLMGHSMGGTIAALFAIERLAAFARDVHPVAGLILSSPALVAGKDVPRWMLAASRIVSRLWPRYKAMKIEPALLSRDSRIVEANRADPLVHHGAVPARTGAELLAAMARIERARGSLRLPVLVYHGTADKLTEPEGSRAFAAHVGASDRTLTLYEGAFHETMNDLGRERVIDALTQWILARS